jgi:hypothetical protein
MFLEILLSNTFSIQVSEGKETFLVMIKMLVLDNMNNTHMISYI